MFGELILNSVLESLLCLFLVCFWIKNKNKKAESFKYSEGFNFGPVLGKLRRMELSDVHTYQALYSETLFRDVIPFWEKHSLDSQHGGYYTCLTTDGAVFDTDKVRSFFNNSMLNWPVCLVASKASLDVFQALLHGRAGLSWCRFRTSKTAMVRNCAVSSGFREHNTNSAESLGAEFLRDHGRNTDGHCYFSLTRKGEPIIEPFRCVYCRK